MFAYFLTSVIPSSQSCFTLIEIELEEKHGKLADKLHTALHEVIGHASGQLNPGVGETKETLKNYASTLEEGRADLVGLYYLYNPKLQELGLVDDWKSVGMAAYDGYIRNGLMTQLIRLKLGDDVEEAHMVNRQWVSAWAFEQGKKDNVIEKIVKESAVKIKEVTTEKKVASWPLAVGLGSLLFLGYNSLFRFLCIERECFI